MFRILVVEDSEIVAKTFAMLLRAMGHEVEVAGDGPTALRLVADIKPDVVFSDISMPRMNGYDLARRLRQQAGLDDLVLVALTGYGQPEDRTLALDAGFDEHMVKPPQFDRLQAFFNAIAARRAASI